MRFLRHGSGVPGQKKAAPDVLGQGPVRPWHTVGLDIPRPVARLQSRTPLPQASIILPRRRAKYHEQAMVARVTTFGFTRSQVKIESGTEVASRGPTWRSATPLA